LTTKALNREQQQVVASESVLLLVQAGPGTGKTHTLVSRVQRMAASGTTPCTVITFTNKAAAEVRERLQREGTMDSAPVMVTTFHGYCLAQLRRSAPQLQVAGPEQRAAIIEELQPGWSSREREIYCRQLSGAFNQPEPDRTDMVLRRYLQTLEARSLIDIDAVIPRTVDLLRQGGAPAEAVRAATGHLFVDEFQDVNEAQYNLVALLARTSTVFAIGDPDQAIYGFRGSNPRWFHAFNRDLHPEVHRLIRNYRSGSLILRAAEQLIANNPHPLPMIAMEACATTSGAMYLQRCAHPEQEAGFIADHIEHHVGGISHRSLERIDHTGMAAVSFRDIAILYRTSAQAEAIGAVLTGRGIPFQVVDLDAYYTKGDCRLLYYWTLVLAGEAQDAHILHLLSREPGMDKQSLELVSSRLRRLHAEEGSFQLGGHWLQDVDLASISGFRLFATELSHHAASQPVTATLRAIIDRYLLAADHPDIKRLVELALTFDQSLVDFAAHLLQYSDSVLYDPRAEAVTLSTLHAAKGLEFPLVFIAGLEEGLLPLHQRHPIAENEQNHVDEERRLLYVGLTRAITTLYLTWCAARSRYGRSPEPCQPSRFLQELPAGSLAVPPMKVSATVRKPSPRQLSLFS
jgi:superfamily I DNA/RNA helicase